VFKGVPVSVVCLNLFQEPHSGNLGPQGLWIHDKKLPNIYLAPHIFSSFFFRDCGRTDGWTDAYYLMCSVLVTNANSAC
jgi:hypothetical protein